MDRTLAHPTDPMMTRLAPLLHRVGRVLAGVARTGIVATASLGIVYAGIVLGITACSLLLQ